MANGRQPEEIAGVAGVDCAGQQALVTGSTSGIGREPAECEGRLAPDAARRAGHERLLACTVDARDAGDLLGLPSVRHTLFDGGHAQNAAHRDSSGGDLELD